MAYITIGQCETNRKGCPGKYAWTGRRLVTIFLFIAAVFGTFFLLLQQQSVAQASLESKVVERHSREKEDREARDRWQQRIEDKVDELLQKGESK